MAIVRHWPGRFSLFLHHMIRLKSSENVSQKWKNLSRESSEMVKNEEIAFLHLGWRVYNLLTINLSRKKVLSVLIIYSMKHHGIPKIN